MGGPTGQTTLRSHIPAGESQKNSTPTGLAWQVLNFVRERDETIRAVRGPCPWEFAAGVTYGAFHGIIHTAAPRDLLVIRTGTQLRRHAGWARDYETLATGLSDDANPRFPDVFVVLNGQVIWSNGVDRARIIDPDGTTVRLGYTRAPSAPVAESPTHIGAGNTDRTNYYSNSGGYSFPGRIGTVGDEISQVEAKLLRGAWYYYAQYEDIHRNLSPMSPPSNAAAVFPQSALTEDGAGNMLYEEIDDLTRQFLVRLTGDAPQHTRAVLLHRTPDTLNIGTQPRLVARIPGSLETLYPDNAPDSELGPNAVDVVGVPVFKIATAHQGRLVIANTTSEPGVVLISEIGRPGTIRPAMRLVPDSNGAEITGLASFEDNLLAFTETSTYLITIDSVGAQSRPLFEGVGCVAPQSIKTRRNGQMLWLSRDGFYSLQGGTLALVSEDIASALNKTNRLRLRLAVATVEPENDVYMCAVCRTGRTRQDLVFCYDANGWREINMGIHIAAMTTLRDARGYVLMGGHDGTGNELLVFDHETSEYTPPSRTTVYRSSWFRADEEGITPFRMRMLYVKMLRSWQGSVTVRFYKDNKWQQVGVDQTMTMVDVPFEEAEASAGTAVIGTGVVRSSPEFWRKCPVPPDLDTCFSFAFELRAAYPAQVHLAAVGFDIAAVGHGQAVARIDTKE